jgi:hypothetical protein
MEIKLAEQNLLDAKAVLDGLNVPFFLSNGTLLGYYRGGGLIGHDSDVDIGIKIADYKEGIVDAFVSAGFTFHVQNGTNASGLEYSFKKRDIGLDIFFYNDTEHVSWMAVWMHHNNKRFKYVYPLICEYTTVKFLGTAFRIPANTEEYLTAQYGDWRTPVAIWDCFSSPRNIESDYWNTFYKYPHTLEPSAFAQSLDLHGKQIIDMGCGNGRDTYYLAKDNDVVGIDQYIPESGPFKQAMLGGYIKEDHKTDILYCRFLLHAIGVELEDNILRWGRQNAREVYIECRSDKGVKPDETHDRRLINSTELLRKCIELGYHPTYFAENIGFAKTNNEDPVIIRLHLKS